MFCSAFIFSTCMPRAYVRRRARVCVCVCVRSRLVSSCTIASWLVCPAPCSCDVCAVCAVCCAWRKRTTAALQRPKHRLQWLSSCCCSCRGRLAAVQQPRSGGSPSNDSPPLHCCLPLHIRRRISKTFCLSNRGHGLYLATPAEIQKFTVCAEFG